MRTAITTGVDFGSRWRHPRLEGQLRVSWEGIIVGRLYARHFAQGRDIVLAEGVTERQARDMVGPWWADPRPDLAALMGRCGLDENMGLGVRDGRL